MRYVFGYLAVANFMLTTIERKSLFLLRLFLAVVLTCCPVLRAVAPAASIQLSPIEQSEEEKQSGEEIDLTCANSLSQTSERKAELRVVTERISAISSTRLGQVCSHLAFSDPFRNGLGTPFRC